MIDDASLVAEVIFQALPRAIGGTVVHVGLSLLGFEGGDRMIRYLTSSITVMEPLLWLPPVMQEASSFKAYDRVRTSVRPQIAARPEAAGRYGDLQIGSKSEQRVFSL
jgi:hypothetical protein